MTAESGISISVGLDTSPFQKDLAAFRTMSEKAGKQVAQALENSVSPTKITKGFNDLARSINTAAAAGKNLGTSINVSGLDSLAKQAGVSASGLDKMYESMVKNAQNRAFTDSLRNIQKLTGASADEMNRLAKSLGGVGNEFTASKIGGGRGFFGGLSTGAVAAALSIGGVITTLKSLTDSMLTMSRLTTSYQSIYGSQFGATQQLDQIYNQTQAVGLQFQQTAQAAKTFFAAAQGSTLAGEANNIFNAVAKGAAALQMSTDDVNGVFLALGQMISKGKVQAEELRGQLGERLPGAFQLAAKAMNMSTAELDKFMADGKLTAEDLLPKLAKALNDQYAEAAKNAANSMQGALNRLSTDWAIFKTSIIDSGSAVGTINLLHDAVLGLQGTFDWIVANQTEIKGVFAALSGASAVYGIKAMADSAGTLRSTLTAIFSLSSRVVPLLASPWGVAAAAAAAAGYAVYRYAEKVDIASQAQRELNAVQRASTQISRNLSDQSNITSKQLDQSIADIEGRINNLGYNLSAVKEKLGQGLSTGNWLEDLFGMTANNSSLDYYGRKLLELRKSASETGNFKVLETSLKDLSQEAEASGRMTDALRQQIKATMDLASLGININVSIGGQEQLSQLAQKIQYWQGIYGNGISIVETDWRERRDASNYSWLHKLDNDYKKTSLARLQQAKDSVKDYQSQLLELSSLDITDAQRSEAANKLKALIKDQQTIIDNANKDRTGLANKQFKFDTGLEQLRQEVANMEATINPASLGIEKLRNKLELEKQNALAAAEAHAKLSVQRKESTPAEAEEKKSLEVRKAELTYTQKLAEAEEKGRQTRVEFYKDFAELSGNYTESLQAQAEAIARQGEEYRNAGIPEQLERQWEAMKKLQTARDPMSGSVRGLRKYANEATDLARGMEDVWGNAFKGMEDAIVTFAQTGKMSFTDMANSIIADLIRIAVRSSITGPLASGIGNMFSGMFGSWTTSASTGSAIDSAVGWVHHTGGMVGDGSAPTRSVPMAAYAYAPRFHSGGGFGQEEYPAVLLRGERVLNRDETRGYNAAMALARGNTFRDSFVSPSGYGSSNQQASQPQVYLNINNSTGEQVSQQVKTDNNGNIRADTWVGNTAAKQMAKPGTAANQTLRSGLGIKQRAIGR